MLGSRRSCRGGAEHRPLPGLSAITTKAPGFFPRYVARLLLPLVLLARRAVGLAVPPFYVYDDPQMDVAGVDVIELFESKRGYVPWDPVNGGVARSQHLLEIWIHRALLDHPSRTLNPEEAAVFYVPIYPVLSAKLGEGEAEAEGPHAAHIERMDAALGALARSPWFRRSEGGDHMVICAGSDICHWAIDDAARNLLHNAVLGAIEPLKHAWSLWHCQNRVLTVPYASRADIPGPPLLQRPSQRNVSFHFVGAHRGTQRANLNEVRDNFPDAHIFFTVPGRPQTLMDDYVEVISQSRWCFAPPGDTPSSRRFFDAVAAGCLPILSEHQRRYLPFLELIPYSNFVYFDPERLSTPEGALELAQDLSKVPLTTLDEMFNELLLWRGHLAVGGEAPSFAELQGPLGMAGDIIIEMAALATPEARQRCEH